MIISLFHFSKGKTDCETQRRIFEFPLEASEILAEYLKLIISRFFEVMGNLTFRVIPDDN